MKPDSVTQQGKLCLICSICCPTSSGILQRCETLLNCQQYLCLLVAGVLTGCIPRPQRCQHAFLRNVGLQRPQHRAGAPFHLQAATSRRPRIGDRNCAGADVTADGTLRGASSQVPAKHQAASHERVGLAQFRRDVRADWVLAVADDQHIGGVRDRDESGRAGGSASRSGAPGGGPFSRLFIPFILTGIFGGFVAGSV